MMCIAYFETRHTANRAYTYWGEEKIKCNEQLM